jgi:preprotein translocase subunit Sss1
LILGGCCFWITGDKEEAEKYFNNQKRICEDAIKPKRGGYGPEAYYDLAGIYAIGGEKEKA